MAIYLVLMVGILLAGRVFDVEGDRQRRKYYVIAVTAVFILLGSLRGWEVGADTPQYVRAFGLASTYSWNTVFVLRYEKGYTVLIKTLSMLTENPQILLVVTSIFNFSAIGYFIYKESEDTALSFVFFMELATFSMLLNAMRQALATAVILFGYELFLKKGYRFRYLLTIVLAMSFHNSGIMGVFFFFPRLIPQKYGQYSKKTLGWILLAGIFVAVAAKALFSVLVRVLINYVSYQDSVYASSNYFGSVILAAMTLGTLMLGMMYLPGKEPEDFLGRGSVYIRPVEVVQPLDPVINDWFWMVSINFVLNLSSMQLLVFDRLRMYFEPFIFLLLPWALSREGNQKTRFIEQSLSVIVLLIYFIICNVLRPDWTGIIPYQFFWQ